MAETPSNASVAKANFQTQRMVNQTNISNYQAPTYSEKFTPTPRNAFQNLSIATKFKSVGKSSENISSPTSHGMIHSPISNLPSFPSETTLFEIDLECGTNPPTPLSPLSRGLDGEAQGGLMSKVRKMTSDVLQTTLKSNSSSSETDLGLANRNNTMTPFEREEQAKEIADMVTAQFL